tara:strand:- start:650 stop:1429 length:780 start_codon:yes stop_codon:yes gene_type:complete
MKKIIKKIFSFFGIQVSKNIFGTYIKYKNKDYTELSFDDIYKKKISYKPIIFDVGANEGQSIKRFKKIFPDSQIHAFEPIDEEFKKLENIYKNDKTVYLNNFALGEGESTKDFYVTKASGNSSFINLNKNSDWIKIRSAENKVPIEEFIKEKKKLKVISLDNYCKSKKIEKIDILKIDTQGYEDKVLSGSQNLIQNEIKFIECEIMLDDVYEKHLNFSDIEKYLIPHDYRLTALNHHGGFRNIYEGHMFVVDVLYSKLK